MKAVNEHRSLATLFSHTFLEKIIDGSYREHILRLTDKSSSLQLLVDRDTTVKELLAVVYRQFSKSYRCEYLYKNTIANELLVKRHSLNSSALFAEFKTGNGWADVIIVNGTTTSYEIKTELDSVARLKSQVSTNVKMFEHNYIVTCEKNIPKITGIIDDEIGLLILEKNGKLTQVREAVSTLDRLDPIFIFNSLRRYEYASILNSHLGFIDDLPNTEAYSVCLELFSGLPLEVIHSSFASVLRKRSCSLQMKRNVERSPYFLRSLFLDKLYTERKFVKIHRALSDTVLLA